MAVYADSTFMYSGSKAGKPKDADGFNRATFVRGFKLHSMGGAGAADIMTQIRQDISDAFALPSWPNEKLSFETPDCYLLIVWNFNEVFDLLESHSKEELTDRLKKSLAFLVTELQDMKLFNVFLLIGGRC